MGADTPMTRDLCARIRAQWARTDPDDPREGEGVFLVRPIGVLPYVSSGEMSWIVAVELHAVTSWRGWQPDLPSTTVRTYLHNPRAGTFELLLPHADPFAMILDAEEVI